MKRRDAMKQLGMGAGVTGIMAMTPTFAAITAAKSETSFSVNGNFDKNRKIRIAMVIFPDMTQLDFTGPYETFIHVPGVEVAVVAETLSPVAADGGLRFLPSHAFDSFDSADVLFVPGGPGQSRQMTNPAMLAYLQKIGSKATYVTSVCTGSLLLAAAGLLEGYRATSHWLSIDQLALFNGIEIVHERVVIDRNRITGGGITAGIDFGLVLAALMRGDNTAMLLELLLEYTPHPPFNTGTPALAGPALVNQAKAVAKTMLEYRLSQSLAAVRNLKEKKMK